MEDPAVLDDRVDRVRAALLDRSGGTATVERRVAASVAHLGIVARLVAPAVATRALQAPGGRDSVSLAPEDLWWQDVLGGPVPLSGVVVDAPPDPLGGSAVEALTRLVTRRYALSPSVAWGNVASAANSAAAMVGASRPELAEAARAAADAFLARPEVEGGVLRAGPGFRRRSCCLIYRIAGSREAVCGDCILAS